MGTTDGGMGFGFGDPPEDFRRLLEGRIDDQLGRFRMFPGGFMFQPQGVMAFSHTLPNGYAVSITRENNEPPKVTVKKGDQTWSIVGDDQEAINSLPEEVREHVQRLLDNPLQRMLEGEMGDLPGRLRDMQLPPWLGEQMRLPREFGVGERNDPMVERMEELERQLKELQQQLQENEPKD